MEFKAFNKIPSLKKIEMTITQKIHGSNAQIVIVKLPDDEGLIEKWMIGVPSVEIERAHYYIAAGSRTRWIYPGDDNYGFAQFVETNKEEFIRKLGAGQHFGEWAGSGINSGEGLTEKKFVLFDHWKYPPEKELPPQTIVVPVLYNGPLDLAKIDEVMVDLKQNGSRLVQGFMRPEGIVINILGQKIKKVFDTEETQWTKGTKGTKEKVDRKDTEFTFGYLLQPIRMEKLLSKDERYLREYPASLPQICADYVADLIEENQIVGDKDQIKAIKKSLGSELFKFAKEMVAKSLT